ncbi:MAG: DUF3309 family protein [Actinobacteria bacterium]|nr:DUF3309 family protein [Actinomycetota bacterium]
MPFLPLLVVGVVLALVLPLWPWSRGWGWTPAGMLAIVLLTAALFVAAGPGG